VSATGKKSSGPPRSELLVLSMEDLDGILGRVRSAGVPEDDCTKLEALVDTVAWLHRELDKNVLTVARLRSLFGLASSEKTKDVLGAETGEQRDRGSEGAETKPKQKAKGHGRNAATAYHGGHLIHIAHDSLHSGGRCPSCPPNKCGKVYTVRDPQRLVRVVGQAPLMATVYELEKLRCNLCGEVFTAAAPPGIGDKKYDVTAASMIALMKYGSGVPFHRMGRLQGNLGIPLPASTQWEIVQEAAAEVAPVHAELVRQAAQGHLLHNDDTSMPVLELRAEIDRLEAAGETDRTGIFSSSIVSELADGVRVALFVTGRKHAGENMADLLRQRARELETPMQMCDGLDRNVPVAFQTVLANCLVHGRRKFVEVVNGFPEECRFVLETLRNVYEHDATTKELRLSADDRLRYHQEHSAPLMAALECWLRAQIEEKRIEPNSTLGAAIGYMRKRWDRLTLFLRKAGAPLDNNLCERALKKAILHRKNALFYKSQNGARVGDLFMSLIHSAELARVNPFDYLTVLLRHADQLATQPDRWLPWRYRETVAQTGPPSLDVTQPP
jgi:hypothetical protein